MFSPQNSRTVSNGSSSDFSVKISVGDIHHEDKISNFLSALASLNDSLHLAVRAALDDALFSSVYDFVNDLSSSSDCQLDDDFQSFIGFENLEMV